MCLLPVAGSYDSDGNGGVVVSWTAHNLLSLAWDRWDEHQGIQVTMNGAVGEVLDALGFQVSPFGTGGAWIVTGHRERPGSAGAQ